MAAGDKVQAKLWPLAWIRRMAALMLRPVGLTIVSRRRLARLIRRAKLARTRAILLRQLKQRRAQGRAAQAWHRKYRAAEGAVDEQFMLAQPELVAAARALQDALASANDAPGGAFVKRCRTRLAVPSSSSTAFQAFVLEANCLGRLREVMERHDHWCFPVSYGLDVKSRTITMSDCGVSLLDLAEAQEVRELDLQLDRMVDLLREASVVHLDANPSGKNITVDRHGGLHLIDFDIAALDGRCINAAHRLRLERFERNGGYARYREQLKHTVKTHPHIRTPA